MPSVPRNKLGKNTTTKQKQKVKLVENATVKALENICEKHSVGDLSFNNCRLATETGQITYVDFEKIGGNMRCSSIVVKVNELNRAPEDIIYNLVDITNKKKEKEQKKLEESKAKDEAERERLRNAALSRENQMRLEKGLEPITLDELKSLDVDKVITETVKPVTDKIEESSSTELSKKQQKHNEYMNKLKTAVEEKVIEQRNKTLKELGEETEVIEVKEDNDDNGRQKTKIEKKRDQILKNMNETLKRKAEKEVGNKYFRRFFEDIRSQFKLEPLKEYLYCEVVTQTTEMVITNSLVYEIKMPLEIKNKYLLIVGDLQMKSKLISQIDPGYKSDISVKHQNDFLEQILSKEKNKVKKSEEDVIEEEPQLVPSNNNNLENNQELSKFQLAKEMLENTN